MPRVHRIFLVCLALLSAAATATPAPETALTIPFSVSLVEPVAGGTAAAPGPAAITFVLKQGNAAGRAPFNPGGSWTVPWFDSQSDPRRFYGVKYSRDQFSLFYEHANVFTLDGSGWLHFYVRPDCAAGSRPCLVPGVYRVIATHSLEFNADFLTLRLAWDGELNRYRAEISRDAGPAGGRMDFRLGRVIDSSGYLACDFHEHPGDLDDFDPRLRLITNLTAGIEVFGISAHNSYRYYQKLIADLGAQDRILSIPSIEYSTVRGHLVVLPQYGYLADPRLGPCDPDAEPAADCPPATAGSATYPLDLPINDTMFFSLRAIAAQRLAAGRPDFVFAAHPDSGYFSLCLDNEANLSDPGNRRSCRPDLDGVEWRRIDSRKWMSLYNQARRFPRIFNTDSHNFQASVFAGAYVRSGFESIPPAARRQSLVDGLVADLAAGRSFGTARTFVRLLEGSTDVAGATLSGAHHDLRLRVQSPASHIPPPTVLVIVNGNITTRTISYLKVATPAGPRLEGELPLALDFDRDSWLMLQAGDTSFATNAVWIDHDGNGTIDPLIPLPKITLTGVAPAVARPGDQVVIEFSVTPAPREVQAWVAPNDPRQNPSCAADRNCDREALCLPPANGLFTSFRCTYRVSGEYPQVERPGPNEVRVAARGSNGLWALALGEIAIAYPDRDGDGLDDGYERLNSRPAANPGCVLNPAAADGDADPDGDGLTSRQEKQAGTMPCVADTDRDGIKDGTEVRSGCESPLMSDTDRDGLCDGGIAVAGPSPVTACRAGEDVNGNGSLDHGETSACNPDSDGDGIADGDEKKFSCLVAVAPDGSADPDRDGLTNLEEFAFGSNPCVADTDADGLNDADEKTAGTDPRSPDSDSDGIRDGDERAAGGDPMNWDSDGDGLSDGEERALGTGIRNPDSDGDGLKDGEEVHEHFSSPLALDTDLDGLDDAAEVAVYHMLPYRVDTDGDGTADGAEVVAAGGFTPAAPLAWDIPGLSYRALPTVQSR